ncbi:transcriptional repressor p66-beta isoform X2 [Agrilus planipennis]|uniref:Transcriptional repressor p66-beta isoform X2 n=1 Tax=Agrilus planipennis TaxID=224129 RepID=A0A1W4WGC7_AGRPL|nr:transcriptional repressor p66-beta isoform X2 [Agrilus planipennis]
MEKMDVDDAVVDLSISRSSSYTNHGNTIANNSGRNNQQQQQSNSNSVSSSRRVLRPRTEPRSYVESPDVLINGSLDRPHTNGLADYSSDSSEGEMPPLSPIKEYTPAELRQRERTLRKLREDLRAEEMKLVLLKKLKQSQQLKENVAVLPPSIPPSALPASGLPSGLSITPTTIKVPPTTKQPPQPPSAHSRHVNSHKPAPGNVPSLLRGQPPPGSRGSVHGPPLSGGGSPLSSRATNLSVPQPPQRASSVCRPPAVFPAGIKDLSPSVTITPAPPQIPKERSRPEDTQTPAQRQAAAKLALRKQLEKTLLQIPPPKPPPPEMHFIPNPSNTEFIYLVGLEYVVDFLTKDQKTPPPPVPFQCYQCNTDFTPVWKWETKGKGRSKETHVVCEQCVTTNVKKALKAEHTNRLKTAFVKALQQEQEIEQRLAQNGVFSSSSPAPSPVTPESTPKAVTPQPTPRHAATPPAPPATQPTPPPPPPSRSSHTGAVSTAAASSHDKIAQNAAAVQALHQQLLRTFQAGVPPHMLQFSPFLYPYQLAMAQAASSGKGAGGTNLAEFQRAADLQRQYLLDMIPPQAGQRHNWKT